MPSSVLENPEYESSGRPEFYIHIFDTRKSQYKRGVPSPRREYSEYQKYATAFANSLYRYIIWEWAPHDSYYDLYNPPKNYKVFSLHRAEDVSWTGAEKYRGELVPVPTCFSLACHSRVLSSIKNDGQIKILRERQLSEHYARAEVEVDPALVPKLAFLLTLTALKQRNWFPGVEVKKLERRKNLKREPRETPRMKKVGIPHLVCFIIFIFMFLPVL